MAPVKKPTISVIGLGKVGSAMVAAYASKGFTVIGYDINPTYVSKIQNHQAAFEEKDLAALLKANKKFITATLDISEAIEKSDISFVIVPTPSEKAGNFSTKYVESAVKTIGEALKKKKGFHVVSLVSTVLPLDSEEKIIPVLEKASGKKVGKGFGYAYNPSFIAIGSIIHNLLFPDIHLIGESDKKTGEILEKFYSQANSNHAPVERMSIPSAEIAKIALNSYVTQKITFANILATLSHNVPNANVDDITRALGGDIRVGKAYLRGGMGYGGPCFPRDNLAYFYTTKRFGVDQKLALSVHDYNERMAGIVFEHILKNLSKKKKIAILGISYKNDSSLLEEAQGIKIVKKLLDKGYKNLVVFDPPPAGDPESVLGKNKVTVAATIDDALKLADVYFISYPCPDFEPIVSFVKKSKGKTVIDPWRAYKEHFSNKKNINYIAFGIGQ
jgi:UDPglucose 6-dehydrogenase